MWGEKRRRIRRLMPAPPAYSSALAGTEASIQEMMLAEALAAEEEYEPGELPTTTRRKHVHYTFVRTYHKGFRQPKQLSRMQMWQHMERLYKEAYPDTTGPTGSILQFGVVATEQHQGASKSADRDEHKHIACFCNVQHYWNKIAKLSAEKYRIPLNAVAHESYLTMYAYLRQHSRKKPLDEIDAEAFLSEFHPRGADLSKLLNSSRNNKALQASRGSARDEGRKRQRLSLFDEVKKHDIQNVQALCAHACNEFQAGNPALAEYCTRQGGKLEDILRNARTVLDAPAKLAGKTASLLNKLETAAESLPCECNGLWGPGADKILERNNIPKTKFCAAVLRALRLGAKRGSNVACIGAGGCGKSTLIEVLEKIISCAPKPEKVSSFPLASVAGYDALLWQDYEHDEDTIRFTDLLSFLMGESVNIRRPGVLNAKLKNESPCFYSGRTRMHLIPSKTHGREACCGYNSMMDERFEVFDFWNPIPFAERQMDFPACGKCGATYFLSSGKAEAANASAQGRQVAPVPASSTLTADLIQLAELHSAGLLDSQEFKAAKQKLLLA